MALGDAYERREFSSNAIATTLNGAMGGTGAVTPSISDATGWPDGNSGPFYALFNDSEICLVTSRSTTTLTIASGGRGQLGTSAANHASGTSVVFIGTGRDLDEANEMVNILGNGTSGLPLLGGGTTTAPAYGQVDTGGIADDAVNADKIDSGDAADIRTALGLVIGTNVQAYDADLAAIAGLTSAADKVPYFTGSGAAAVADFTSAGRALVDDANAAAQRTTLGLGALATLATVGTSQVDDAAVTLAKLATTARARASYFSRSGTLVTGTGTMRMRFPQGATLLYFTLDVETAPTGTSGTPITGQSLVVDIHRSGTTVFTTQANRPTIAASAKQETAQTAPDVTSVSSTQYLTCDIDYVGSSVAGADLVVGVHYYVPSS